MALLFQLKQTLALGFQAFWVRWPRKVAKLEASKAWNQVVTPEDEEPIQKALDWQLSVFAQRQPEHIPHAATWIRGRRWEDEPPPTTTRSPATVKAHPMALQQLDAAARIKSLIQTGMDPETAKQTIYQELGWIKRKDDPSVENS